jgi:hypothetical protein
MRFGSGTKKGNSCTRHEVCPKIVGHSLSATKYFGTRTGAAASFLVNKSQKVAMIESCASKPSMRLSLVHWLMAAGAGVKATTHNKAYSLRLGAVND